MNNKRRLFEMFERVNGVKLLTENTLTIPERNQIIENFIEFVNAKLKLDNNIPTYEISYDENYAKENKSFAYYDFVNNHILVCASNRNLADILRSLAHEIVHHKQNLENRIKDDSGNTGSDIENEANAMAGVLLREYGKINPNIYE
jgi:Zn-dependent peptidase ImmA (M78 family)